MRQRNPGPSTLVAPDVPAEVPPGGEVDYPLPLAGFEVVEAPKEPEPADPPAAAGKSSKAAKKPTGVEETPVNEAPAGEAAPAEQATTVKE